MPELPEAETLRRRLVPKLVGRTIGAVDVRDARLRRRVDARRLRRLAVGRAVRAVDRRSKFLLLRLEGGATVVVHLGMSGTLRVAAPGAPLDRHDHVRLALGDRELRYRDPRRFGSFYAVAPGRLDRHPDFAALGPEPFDPALDAAWLHRRAARRRTTLKAFLMDQRTIAGLGNIYVNEALFVAGRSPRRRAGGVGAASFERILAAVREVLAGAIAAGGTTLRDFADDEGRPGAYRGALRVYGRDGAPCPRCGAAIRRFVLGGRATYACGRCQR